MRTSKDAGRPDRRSSSQWARAREWLGRLLGHGSFAVQDKPRPVPRQGAATQAEPARAQPAARLTASELALVCQDLRKVLDQHAQARRVMRYLRALEHGLHKKGRLALEVLPAELLRRALGQLDLLVTDRSLPGLATLRSKAAISIAERERGLTGGLERCAQAQPASAQADVLIQDVSHDTFIEASEQWERSFTGQSMTLPLDLDTLPAEGDAAARGGTGPAKRMKTRHMRKLRPE